MNDHLPSKVGSSEEQKMLMERSTSQQGQGGIGPSIPEPQRPTNEAFVANSMPQIAVPAPMLCPKTRQLAWVAASMACASTTSRVPAQAKAPAFDKAVPPNPSRSLEERVASLEAHIHHLMQMAVLADEGPRVTKSPKPTEQNVGNILESNKIEEPSTEPPTQPKEKSMKCLCGSAITEGYSRLHHPGSNEECLACRAAQFDEMRKDIEGQKKHIEHLLESVPDKEHSTDLTQAKLNLSNKEADLLRLKQDIQRLAFAELERTTVKYGKLERIRNLPNWAELDFLPGSEQIRLLKEENHETISLLAQVIDSANKTRNTLLTRIAQLEA